MQKTRKIIISVLVIGILTSLPITSNAARIKSSSRVRVSRPSISKSVKKSSIKTSGVKSSINTKSTSTPKPSTKVDSGTFSTNLKSDKVTTKKVTSNNNFKKTTYTPNTSFRPSKSFLTYYMLDEVFDVDDLIEEDDVVKALENKGYTNDEIKTILETQKNPNAQQDVKFSKLPTFILSLVVILGFLFVLIFFTTRLF